MQEEQKQIIEINGIKMEVDLRHAKVIDQYKVGDSIKVLLNEYGEKYKSYIGTIIGFDNFEKHPTIVIAYLKTEYSSATIDYVYFNSETKDVEITALNDWDIPVTKAQVIEKMDKMIESKANEIKEVEQKKALFERLFGQYFEKLENPQSV